MVYAAPGDKTRAGSLRDVIGSVGLLTNDISVTSLDTFVDCPGLSAPMDGFAAYEVDGYIAYSSATAADIQFALGCPPDVFGSATFFPQAQAGTGGIGDADGFRQTSFSDLFPQGAAGAGVGTPMACQLSASIRCFRFGGAVQLRFCQITSTASATVVHAGSWIRASLIGHTSP